MWAPFMRLTHHRHEGMWIGVGCMAASAVDTSTKPRVRRHFRHRYVRSNKRPAGRNHRPHHSPIGTAGARDMLIVA
jgi:hypothetical protein